MLIIYMHIFVVVDLIMQECITREYFVSLAHTLTLMNTSCSLNEVCEFYLFRSPRYKVIFQVW